MISLNTHDKFKVVHKNKILEFEVAQCKFTGEVYGQQRQAILKDKYSEKDIAENTAYENALVINNDELIQINDITYLIKVHGNFIDGVSFIK